MEMKKIQKEIWLNKINKGFNTTDVNKEFCLLYGEVGEAYEAYRKKKDDLEDEIEKKIIKNKNRVYKNIDGVNVRISD